ncbi:type VII secretion protein EccC [Nocardioides korecus]
MSTTLRRGPKLEEPRLPEGEIVLQPPPELAPHEGLSGALMMALPMLGSVGSIVFVAASGSGQGPQNFIAAGMFLVATLGFVFVNIDRQRKQRGTQVAGQRREYLQYLSTVRRQVRAAADQQRDYLTWNHPEPDALPTLAEDGTRLWDRTGESDDLMHVRYGRTAQPLALDLVAPEAAPVDQLDPVSASALHRLLAVHRVQPDLPAALDLRAFATVEVCGPRDRARALARALVCSAAAFQSPEQLLVAVLTSEDDLAQWEWLKWLPHAQSPTESDAIGPERMVCTSVEDAIALLPSDLKDRPRFGSDQNGVLPHVLLVLDGGTLPPGNHLVPAEGVHGMTVIDLPRHPAELTDPATLRLSIADAAMGRGVPVVAERAREGGFRCVGDQMDLATAEAFARRLAPLHVVDGPVRDELTAKVPEIGDLLALGDVTELDLGRAWERRPERDRLRVPIGVGENGAPIHLDIKEAAQQGMGPHGLVIGATGSGKSEFLRTLVLGLAMTHSPETLNMVLVDFKGGATFAGLSEMPHVSAVITNLENELTLVDRMQDALSGEMVRRQELLRTAGNYASVRDYEKARQSGAPLDPLPSLFIVVDEFSEMLTAKPEFIDLFVAIGRLGRSLGLHLLLASQRLEEGRLRGLESHLSYRVGLRTFSAAESRTVLGVPDAYELPSVPGLGYLKPDQSTLLRFKAAYVSGPPPRRRGAGAGGLRARSILPFTLGHVLAPAEDEPEVTAPTTPAPWSSDAEDSTLDVAVAQMVGQGPEAHKVWLPPLDAPDTLDALTGDLAVDEALGLVSRSWHDRPGLQIPLGTVDRPREQRRDTLTVDLAGSGGHVAVVGGPRSGKSTLMRTIMASLATTRSPQEVQCYVLDFGGGTFTPFLDLPHCSGVATRSEPDVVRRIAAEVTSVVDTREAYFRAHGIDSIETYRHRRAQGLADDGYGDLFLFVDGWGTLRSDFDELEISLQALAQRGLTFGLHIVAAAPRWADFRAAIRDVLGTRLELRLGEPSDSEVDRRVAALVPTGRPGRGLTTSKLHFLAAVPRIDGVHDAVVLSEGVTDLIERSQKAWGGPSGPKLRLLPERIAIEDVLAQAAPTPEDRRVLLGIDERALAPVGFDVDTEPHLTAYGDSGSGKSTLLRTYVREVMRTRTSKEAQFLVVDYRRGLLGEVPEDYLLEYVTNAGQAAPMFEQVRQYLTNRLPGPDVTAEQLRHRSWWTGSDLYVVVDDYDLVASSQGNPLAPLIPLLAQASDVGLHLVVARRAGGASRSFDQVLQALGDLAMPVMVLPGSPDEGPVVGRIRPKKDVPGRTQLSTRNGGLEVVQLAWSEPAL